MFSAISRKRASPATRAASARVRSSARPASRVAVVDVSTGEQVAKGQRLLTLEAMKMEHALVAPFYGVVAELSAVPGSQVQVDAVLVRVEKAIAPA